jgi:hypothetical protein
MLAGDFVCLGHYDVQHPILLLEQIGDVRNPVRVKRSISAA